MARFVLIDELAGWLPDHSEEGTAKAVEPVLKHPGHADQKVHGRKGGVSDSGGETHQVMRGVAMNLPSDVASRVHALLQPPADESEIDQHLKVGPILLDQFQRGGGGAHWTGSARGIAEIGAGARSGGNHLPVIVHAEYKGSRLEAGRSALHDEDEHTIPRGTAMRVTGIEVKTPDGWLSVLSDPVDIVLGEVQKAVEPVLKHPGHADQKVHGRKGGAGRAEPVGSMSGMPPKIRRVAESFDAPRWNEFRNSCDRGGGCEDVAAAIEQRFGIPQVTGTFTTKSGSKEYHSWNQDASGWIVDGGQDVFPSREGDGSALMFFAPGAPQYAVDSLAKHGSHNQKDHAGKGGGSATAVADRPAGSDLPDGWSQRSREEVVAEFERKAIDEWESTASKAREYAEKRADYFDYYDGPNGSTVVIEKTAGIKAPARDRLLKQVEQMQGVAPNPGMNVEVGESAYRYHNEDPRTTGGFAYLGRPQIYLAPRSVTQGFKDEDPDWLMPSVAKNRRAYPLAHEWAHTIDKRPPSKSYDDWKAVSTMSGMSKYGRSNDRESFAEAFVEWHLTGGRTSSEAVAYYRDTYNWGSEGGVTVAKAAEQVVTIIADTFGPEGGIIREDVALPNLVEWTLAQPTRKAVTIGFAPGLRPVIKHLPGKHDQKSHGRPGLSPKVAASILERVKANGGLSVNMLDGSEPTSGYMVAKGGDIGDIVPADKFFDPKEGPKALGSFMKANRDTLTKGSYLGLWHNTEDGNVYLDVSDNILDRGTAERAGRERNQISIWDVANFQEINTGGTGELSKTASGDPDAGPVEDDGRGDRRLRQEGVGDVHRPRGAVFGFDPGFRPILKHGDPSRPGYAAMHPNSEGRIGVHSGRRTDVKNPEKADKALVHEATSFDELPTSMQDRISEGLDNLGITPEQMDANIEAVYLKAKARKDPPDGQDWYDEANSEAARISEEHGLTREQAAGMIAATSPQQAWGDNVAAVDYMGKAIKEDHEVQVDDLLSQTRTKTMSVDGKNVKVTKSMYEWAAAECGGRTMDGTKRVMPDADELRGKRMSDLDPYVAAALMKAHAQIGYRTPDGKPLSTIDDLTGRSTPVRFTCGVHHLGRAVRISRGESPDYVLNGHKVRSFYNNIAGPRNRYDDVTVDSHAFSVAMGRKYSSGSTEYKYFSGSGAKKRGWAPIGSDTLGVVGLYSAYADSYRRVAAKYGLTGRQMQAITWVQWRRDNPDNVRGSQMKGDENG